MEFAVVDRRCLPACP
uniref:Uncharacterized protein n=1 Tax=Arundo donax TaxID=35708 RepID=A0A0A8Z0I1_ARUDO